MARLAAVIGILGAAVLLAAVCGHATPPVEHTRYTAAELAAIERHSPLGPAPPDPTDRVADSPRAAALGQFLFFDTRLSSNGKISCAFCHRPADGFTDGRKVAKGLLVEARRTPTVINAAFNQWFFWDGRADSLWSQALQPLEDPREFASDRLRIVHVVAADPALREAYQQVFGPLPPLRDRKRFPADARPDADPKAPVACAWQAMSVPDRIAVDRAFSNLGKAIEAYERRLVRGDAPFDRYVRGLRSADPVLEQAISPAAKRGLKLFVGAANCELCHSGPNFTDNQFHNLGLPLQPGEAPDPGRSVGIGLIRANPFNGAGAFSDDPHGSAKDKIVFLPAAQAQLGAFKTPSLRGVAAMAFHMHDGRFATLPQVLQFYADGEAATRGRLVGTREATANLVPHLTKSQQADLVAFLETLTGATLPPALLQPPPTP
ncbi:MAG TPA: cytochrome c peroxidase [Stellaceae bacterium]|nr:cytochrome c peroxidase [Stellaceae bacterium]